MTHRIAGLLLSLTAAVAVTAVPGARGAENPPAPAAGFELPPVAVPAPGAAESGDAFENSKPVRVLRVTFRGNKALRTSALEVVAAPYLGRDLTGADIEQLRIALTRQYTDRGYLNSGVVLDPASPYHEGELRFVAIEGHIKEVRVQGLEGLRRAYVVDRLRGADDEPLNTDVLRERFQRLLDDPLFARINSRIEPGENLGEAILDVNVERARPYSASLALNNYRPPSIGEKGYDWAGQVRDLTGWGDVFDADVNGPLEFTGGIGYSIAWQVPLNHYGTQIAASVSSTDSVITEEPLSSLDIKSTIARQELRLTQPLARSLTQQFSVGIGISREKNSTTLAGQSFSFLPGADNGLTRSNTVRFVPDYSYRSEHQYLGVRVTILHAALLDQPTAPVAYAAPKPRYYVSTGQVHYVWEFAPLPFELDAHATVQRTNARISDLHEIEIGGLNSVRGFREDEILLSNVQNFNLDLRWLALPAGNSARPGLNVGTFFDWAAGYDVGGPTSTFSSCGATLRAKWTHVQADLAYGVPIIRPGFVAGQHGSWQDHGFHVQIAAML